MDLQENSFNRRRTHHEFKVCTLCFLIIYTIFHLPLPITSIIIASNNHQNTCLRSFELLEDKNISNDLVYWLRIYGMGNLILYFIININISFFMVKNINYDYSNSLSTLQYLLSFFNVFILVSAILTSIIFNFCLSIIGIHNLNQNFQCILLEHEIAVFSIYVIVINMVLLCCFCSFIFFICSNNNEYIDQINQNDENNEINQNDENDENNNYKKMKNKYSDLYFTMTNLNYLLKWIN